MDFAKIQYFEKIETPKHQEYITSQNNCVLCGSNLELRHMPVPEKNEVKEEAHCPSCEMRTRAKVFTFQ